MITNLLHMPQQLHQIMKKLRVTEIISNIKYFIDHYNWKEINFLSNKKDWNEF